MELIKFITASLIILCTNIASANPGAQLYRALETATDVERSKILFTLNELNRNPLPDTNRYIIVNVPGYSLRAYQDDTVVLSSKVIVGRPNAKTPTMTSNLTGVKYNPDWNAPPSIVKSYTQKIKNGQLSYFTNHGIKVTKISTNTTTRYHFSQPPGENNALGVIKFELDNSDSIYLHDTNERDKFTKNYRALSSGCVRVEEWKYLGAWVTKTNITHIEQQQNTNMTHTESTEVIPVYLGYFLAWPDEDGQIVYFDDIYKKM